MKFEEQLTEFQAFLFKRMKLDISALDVRHIWAWLEQKIDNNYARDYNRGENCPICGHNKFDRHER
jgi:hypothetical protein